MSIVEMFRIALENVGNTDVRFITGGVLQRRKSKIPLLDVPKGMPRNLSESQLVQISSKAFSNVAGQFSKLGQSLNPNKNKSTGTMNSNVMKHTFANNNAAVECQSQSTIDKCAEAEKVLFTLGRKQVNSATSSDSEDNDNSIYEPDEHYATAAEKSGFNQNDFLPSVGIVMCNSSTQEQLLQSPTNDLSCLEDKDNSGHIKSEDVCTISISSVTDHVTMPSGLLENAAPVRPITPNPQICVMEDRGFAEEATSSAEQSRSVFYC